METTNLNDPIEPLDATDRRLMDLEIKASYQEDLLDQLNQIIARQQQDMDWLLREVRQLRKQVFDSNGSSVNSLVDELPPHY